MKCTRWYKEGWNRSYEVECGLIGAGCRLCYCGCKISGWWFKMEFDCLVMIESAMWLYIYDRSVIDWYVHTYMTICDIVWLSWLLSSIYYLMNLKIWYYMKFLFNNAKCAEVWTHYIMIIKMMMRNQKNLDIISHFSVSFENT